MLAGSFKNNLKQKKEGSFLLDLGNEKTSKTYFIGIRRTIHEMRHFIRTFGTFHTSLALAVVLFVASENGVQGQQCSNVLMKYRQPDDIGKNTTYDDLPDDEVRCARNCTQFSDPRVCYYQFTLEQYNCLGPACDTCWSGVNPGDCFNPQCVPGDGVEKTVLVINRMFMGPAIQVCYNDTVIIDVHNQMPARDIAIHWHGILQQETPYMDGVPLITQCPISEGQRFRYNFTVHTNGTHFYHSHSAFHEFEGISGVFIVRTTDDAEPNRNLYDFDKYSHVLHIADWMHMPEDDKYPGANRDEALITEKADSYLINGLGTYQFNNGSFTPTPIAKFLVESGFRYRFRIIGATSHTCNVRVTIQDHPMTVISTDGYDIEPVVVRTIFMRAGELTDIVINATETPDCYVIRVQGTDDCENALQYGLLCYEESSAFLLQETFDPPVGGIYYSDDQSYYDATDESLFDALPYPTLNQVRGGCITDPDSICMDEIQSLDDPPPRILAPNPDHRFFLNLKSYLFTYDVLYRSNTFHRHYLPFSGPTRITVNGPGAMVNDNINDKSNFFPPSPFYTTEPPADLVCPNTCENPPCECFFYIHVQRNSSVELVIIDEISQEPLFAMDHPMHLHGHHFWILRQGTKLERTADPFYYLNTVLNSSFIGTLGGVSTNRPNHRDVVAVPAEGFAVIRFQANNTGTWVFHCHFTVHNHNGMSVVFQVGNRTEFKPVPAGWPTCGDFLPPVPPEFGQCSTADDDYDASGPAIFDTFINNFV